MISSQQQSQLRSTIKTPKIPKLAWKRQWKLQRIANHQVSQAQATAARSTSSLPQQTLNISFESTPSYPQHNNFPQNAISSMGPRRANNSCLQILSSTCHTPSIPALTSTATSTQINTSSTFLTRKRKLDELVSNQTISLPNFKIRKLENGKLTQHPKVKNALSYVF
jgi:hypothetical protein